MGCSGAYATAWEYAAFFCASTMRTGLHQGANGAAALVDASVNFLTFGVKPMAGMVLYNLTQNANGPITNVTQTTLTATGVLWNASDSYRVVAISANEIGQINHILTITAGDVHAALAASGACNCTLSAWGVGLLAKLNIIEAGTFHTCPCGNPNLTDGQRKTYLDWITQQLELIRTGKIDVCEGATGSEFPAIGWAEQATTEFAAIEIIENDLSSSP